jgi:hypothetical protein
VARLRELVQDASDEEEHGKKKKKKSRKGDEEDMSGAEDGDGRSKKRKGGKRDEDERGKDKRQRPDALQEALMSLSGAGAGVAVAKGAPYDQLGGIKPDIKPAGARSGASLAGLSAVAAVLSAPFEPSSKGADKREAEHGGLPGMGESLCNIISRLLEFLSCV